jgi:hypothetical protein
MRRLLFAAPLAILLGSVACGDGPGKDDAEATQAAAESPTPGNVNEQPQVPDKDLPTPTPIPDTLPVVQVVVAGKPFAPTRGEFGALPKVKIDAGGKSYEGVSLSVLAEKAGAAEGAVATIQGTRADNLRLGAIRFPLGEIGASTVFMLDEGGRLVLASSSVPPDQWLKDVTGIALN